MKVFLMSLTDLVMMIPALGPRRKLYNAIQSSKSGTVYICFVCKEGLNSFNSLFNHIKTRHRLNSNNTYQCIHCESLFNKRSYYNHFRNIFKIHKNLLNTLIVDNTEEEEEVENCPLDIGTSY